MENTLPLPKVLCGFSFFYSNERMLITPLLIVILYTNLSAVLATILPEFAEPVPNVTIPLGREAVLSCAVNHLGSYKVAWVKVESQTILTIHHHVITRNYRIFLTHSDHKFWYLHINNVHERDRGFYMCQINTVPMRSVQGYLEVVVPPNIMDNETSLDLVVKEGANVSLFCRASGYPKPFIRWQREDNKMITLNTQLEVSTVDGEVLNINRVSRLHMGAYLCIANNGIPPSVSKRIVLKVHFPPMIWIPHQRVTGAINSDVTLECHTEAYPKSINYWTTEEGEMISSGDKFTSVALDSTYQMHMRLTIHHLSYEDFGSYRCIAKNSLGETGGTIRLLEVTPSTPVITTTTEKMNFESKGHLGENKNRLHYTIQGIGTSDKKNSKGKKISIPDHSADVKIADHKPRPQSVNNHGAKQVYQLTVSSLCLLLVAVSTITWSLESTCPLLS